VSRRLHSVLFLVGATVLNLLLLFFYFLAFTGIVGLFIPDRTGWVAVTTWVLLFVTAVAADWFTYRWAFRILKVLVPLERWLDPNLFKGLF